jgi:hypothetical protein
MRWYQPLLYLWVFPATLIGLLPIPIVLLQGGSLQWKQGILELHGGLVTKILRSWLPWVGSASAMTIGHIVWGIDEACLDHSRAHEHVHVRQYERWGPFFIPAYFLASWLVARRGLNPYLDNPFEREAYEKAP